MPFEWNKINDRASANAGAFSFANGDPPAKVLHVWPHRSLPRKGFAWFILITCGMLLLPLLALLGTMALWGLLPFLAGAVALTWYLIERSYKDGELREELSFWTDRLYLHRYNPRHEDQYWEANPHWVTAHLKAEGGPVANYLTLRGDNRKVELGAYLSPDERRELHREIQQAIHTLNASA